MFISKPHEMPCSHTGEFRTYTLLFANESTKYVQYWLHVFAITTDGTIAKNFCQFVQKRCKGIERKKTRCKGIERKKTKRKAIAKLLPLHVNVKGTRNKSERF